MMNGWWIGLCIVFSTYLACDTYLFAKGYESSFWCRKTEREKKLGGE